MRFCFFTLSIIIKEVSERNEITIQKLLFEKSILDYHTLKWLSCLRCYRFTKHSQIEHNITGIYQNANFGIYHHARYNVWNTV